MVYPSSMSDVASGTPTASGTSTDGRRVRRERNRTAVVDAMFALLQEGHLPPSADQIAERAGVSVSSVFRYFDDLDDLQRQTIDRYFERFAPLFTIPDLGQGPRDARIARYVEARLTLYEATEPIARMARFRAVEQGMIAQSLADTRAALAGQVRTHFAPELAGMTRAEGDDLVALVDSLTAFEAWDLLHADHRRSRTQIRRAWTRGLARLLG